MQQPATGANAPAIAKEARLHGFAHGLAAEQHGLDTQKCRAVVKLDVERARE
ncbi:hypothetical protein D9M68_945850 [compost metagenome]